MHFERLELTAKVVKMATDAAAEKRDGVSVWADVTLPYLTIRQRGGSVKWTLRAKKTMKTIGDVRERHPEFLSVRAAREKAATVYATMRFGGDEAEPADDAAPAGWTVGWLCLRYQRMMSEPRWVNNREKPPSAGTLDDIRLAFAKESYQVLGPIRVTDLNRPTVNAANAGIESYRQRQKNTAYLKAALSWAADKFPDDSGLTENVDRWWEHLSAGDPDAATMRKITTRRAAHLAHKEALDVEAIGELLVRHEAYCAGRTAEEKVSPGIRFGLWWVAFTANRRTSTVKLRREDFLADDPLHAGWGRAMWPADTMKAKVPFWLPLPDAVRDIATGSIADYTQLVANHHGDWPSKWVFASTRRYGRDPDNTDVSVYPNSLNKHLRVMRDAKALDGLPYFSLHLARSVMANFLDTKVSPVASSLVLAHTLPQTDRESSPTTREYYLTSQRMDVKAEAMAAWCEALCRAVERAGGKLPAPRETWRRSKVKAA
ncbi:MAG: hypothetical protein Q7T73_02650 [Beijerinckiaceae bacterium]|nr:hypothetical protein [Beijerinckiaceae bacterium]